MFINFSDPSTTKIILTHAISGEAFNAQQISSDVTISQISLGNFKGSFSTKAGDHNGQYTVQLEEGSSFSEPYSYFVPSKVSVTIEEQKFPLLKVMVSVDGKGK